MSAVVVGAGAGGLVAAWELARAGCEVTLIEAGSRLGGLLGRVVADDLVLDAGAEGFSVRGGEVADLLAALNTGHDGSAGTVHANSPTELPARLEALGALGGLDRAALSAQVAASLRVVVGMRRYPDGRRGVDSMGVVRREADGIVVDPVWRADGGEVPGRAGFAALVAGRRP